MNLIINAKIYTMTDAEIPCDCIAFDDKIRYVGMLDDIPVPRGEMGNVIDAKGAVVTPGLIDAHCHVGIVEDSLGFEGDDSNEDSDPVTPHLRAIDAINPFDRAFADAIKAGVTTVVTGPGSANPIGGEFAAVKTYGICVDDMVIKSPAAMKFALGENPKTVYHGKNQAPVTRMGTAAVIREALIRAAEYRERLERYKENPDENDKPDFDIKLDALLPVLSGSIPAKIHAHRADDICTAIRIAKEFNLDATIEHCTDGASIMDILIRERIPVMLGPTLSDRSKPELKNLSFFTYPALSSCGLDIAIITDHPEITIENLPLCAAMAVKYGMDEMKALEAITISAAKNCRIDDRVGSIAPGKDADICIFSDIPVRFDSYNIVTIINGQVVYER